MKRIGITGLAASGLAALLLFAGNASASEIDLSVSVQSVTANAGDNGDTFELTVTNAGTSTVTVAGFGFEVALTDTDITLTDATDASSLNPYIFDGTSLFGPEILGSTDGQTLTATDIYFGEDPGITLNSGDSYSLGEVSFNVAADAAPGDYTITLSQDPAGTNFSGPAPDADLIAIGSYNDGTITIPEQEASATPEPATWSSLLIAGAFMAFKFRRPSARSTEPRR